MENEYIDLGLPSGTLWARFNVGVIENLKEVWEEDLETLPIAQKESETGAVLNSSEIGCITDEGKLPTKDQFEELIKFTVQSKGSPSCCRVRFTGKNGNYIVLPSHETATCYYISGCKEVLYVHHDGEYKFLPDTKAYNEKKIYCVRLVKQDNGFERVD